MTKKISVQKVIKTIYRISPKLFIYGLLSAFSGGLTDLLIMGSLALMLSPKYSFFTERINQFSFFNNDAFYISPYSILISIILLSSLIKIYSIDLINKISGKISVKLSQNYIIELYKRNYRNVKTIPKSKLNYLLFKVPDQISLNAICPLFMAISSLISVITILISFILIQKNSILFSMLIVALFFVISAKFSKKSISNLSRLRLIQESELSENITEMIDGYKDIKLNKIENISINNYKKILSKLRLTVAKTQLQGIWPKNLLETTAIIVFIYALYLESINDFGDFDKGNLTIIIIGLFKILPTANTFYLSWSNILSHLDSITDVFKATNFKKSKILTKANYSNKNSVNLFDNKSIDLYIKKFSLDNINKKNRKNIFKDFSIKFDFGEIVAIRGPSGSGKTTLLEAFCGLYDKENVFLKSGDKEIFHNKYYLDEWQRNLSYVPQDIFIFEGKADFNVTIEKDRSIFNKDDWSYLKECFEMSCLDDIEIDQEICKGRNLLISGGQKQRISIARALFRRPKVLVLDEATSALDSKRANQIFKNLNSIKKKMIILFVTHNDDLLKYADKVIDFTK